MFRYKAEFLSIYYGSLHYQVASTAIGVAAQDSTVLFIRPINFSPASSATNHLGFSHSVRPFRQLLPSIVLCFLFAYNRAKA